MTQAIKSNFAEYCELQYRLGYEAGITGCGYEGRTFIGYHGYVAGRKRFTRRQAAVRIARRYCVTSRFVYDMLEFFDDDEEMLRVYLNG